MTTTTTTDYKVCPPGEDAGKYVPGDFVLVSSKGILAKFIKFGQFIRYHGEMKPFSKWNHAVMVIDEDGSIIEAVGRGVVISNISEYKDVEYYYVSTNLNKQNRDQTVAACKNFLKDKYGWVTILSIAMELLSGIKIQFTNSNTMICSAVVGQSLWAGGIIFDTNPYQMMPADLAAAFKIFSFDNITKNH